MDHIFEYSKDQCILCGFDFTEAFVSKWSLSYNNIQIQMDMLSRHTCVTCIHLYQQYPVLYSLTYTPGTCPVETHSPQIPLCWWGIYLFTMSKAPLLIWSFHSIWNLTNYNKLYDSEAARQTKPAMKQMIVLLIESNLFSLIGIYYKSRVLTCSLKMWSQQMHGYSAWILGRKLSMSNWLFPYNWLHY